MTVFKKDKLLKFLNRKNLFIFIIVIILGISYIIIENITGKEINTSTWDEEIEENDIESIESTEEKSPIEDKEITSLLDEVEVEIEEEKSENTGIENDIKKIYVYITGEVNSPGVVILDEGSRIVDAIEAAGGVTSKANITKVNLVYIVHDGMKVNIPNNNDLKNNSNFEYITMGSGDEKNDANYSISNSFSESSSSGKETAFKTSIVNINTATQTELETLPGIGPSLALKIINYRNENGKFKNIEDLKNVSGIGESKFENIKNFIIV